MHRTTIMLPQDLRLKAAEEARNRGISLGELVRDSLSAYLASSSVSETRDLFLEDDAVFEGDVPTDLAENHDHYLYGDES